MLIWRFIFRYFSNKNGCVFGSDGTKGLLSLLRHRHERDGTLENAITERHSRWIKQHMELADISILSIDISHESNP